MFVRSLLVGFTLCALAVAQQAASAVAEINGRKYTAAEVDLLVDNLDYYEREMARINLPEALKFYAFRELLAAEAEKAQLAEQSPSKEELAVRRVAILMPAAMEQLKAAQPVTPEQVRAYYDEHKEDFEKLRFKLLFVSFGPAGKSGARTAEEAKSLTDDIKRKLDAGASFTELVKQHSDAAKSRERGGDYATPVTRTSVIPGGEEVLPILFSLQPGKVSEPVRVANGFDLFQVTERKVPVLEEALPEVEERLRIIARSEKLVELEKSVDFKIERPEFFAAVAKPGEKAPADYVGNMIVAKLDGRNINIEEIGRIAEIFPPAEKEKILQDKVEMLRKFGLMARLAAQAEKAGAARKPPFRQRLATTRALVLAQAQMTAAATAKVVTPEDQRRYYDEHKDDYLQVRATGVYIPFGPGKRTEAEAKARAGEFLAKVKAGGLDVSKLIREYSEDETSRERDGDLGVISKNAHVDAAFKQTVFSLSPGQWSMPLAQPNGFYVLRAESNGLVPYDEVKELIYREIQQAAFNEYVTALQKQAQFKVLDAQYFAQRPGGKFL